VTPAELIQACRGRGLTLCVVGDRILVRPARALSAQLRSAIVAARAELIVLLAAQQLEVSRLAARDVDDPRVCTACGEVRPVMMLMAAGLDGRPWVLCAECWR
jgi:hypothetical protein